MGNILLNFLNWWYQAIFNLFSLPLIEIGKILFQTYGFDINSIITKLTYVYDTYIIGYTRFIVSLLHYSLHFPMWILETIELLIYAFLSIYVFSLPFRIVSGIYRSIIGKFN